MTITRQLSLPVQAQTKAPATKTCRIWVGRKSRWYWSILLSPTNQNLWERWGWGKSDIVSNMSKVGIKNGLAPYNCKFLILYRNAAQRRTPCGKTEHHNWVKNDSKELDSVCRELQQSLNQFISHIFSFSGMCKSYK